MQPTDPEPIPDPTATAVPGTDDAPPVAASETPAEPSSADPASAEADGVSDGESDGESEAGGNSDADADADNVVEAADASADSTPEAPAASSSAPAPAPADLSPAQCSARLAKLFPALFNLQQPKPLKLRIQADIQARAPGVFTRKSLSGFLHRYTTGTPYVLALTRDAQRYDLDGQPAGELAAEHREAAVTELARRRAIVDTRRAAEQAARREADAAARQQQEADQQGRRERALLLRAFETSTLTRANFCALKGLADAELDGLLAQARKEAAERPAWTAPHGAPHGTSPGAPPARPGRHGSGAPHAPGAPGRPEGPEAGRHRPGPRPEGGGRGPRKPEGGGGGRGGPGGPRRTPRTGG